VRHGGVGLVGDPVKDENRALGRFAQFHVLHPRARLMLTDRPVNALQYVRLREFNVL
jgi:hypothetical protein